MPIRQPTVSRRRTEQSDQSERTNNAGPDRFDALPPARLLMLQAGTGPNRRALSCAPPDYRAFDIQPAVCATTSFSRPLKP